MPELKSFTCPRCREPAEEEFFGPCSPCRVELRQIVVPPPRDPNYVERMTQDGRRYMEYVGPRTKVEP